MHVRSGRHGGRTAELTGCLFAHAGRVLRVGGLTGPSLCAGGSIDGGACRGSLFARGEKWCWLMGGAVQVG